MLKILIIKEIQTAIIDFRFWVVMLLCLSIIPLSFYVTVKNYGQRVSDYQQEIQTYRAKSEGDIYAHFKAEGVHPPSPLSIFSQGLGNKMPYKVVTSRDGRYSIEYAKPDNKEDLLGQIDFAFIVSFVLSILALVFTFSAISGDKENGIFRIVLSNPVLRSQILLSKLIGNFIVFSIPFLMAMALSLIIVYVSGLVPVFSAALFPSVLLMIGISLLFLFALFCLGLWISALARSSILSINILLLVWIVIGLVIPKISPIISETIYPVESGSVFESKKSLLLQSIIKEQDNEEIAIYEEIRGRLRPGTDGVSSAWEDINHEYDAQVTPIREKYMQKITSELSKLTSDYQLRCNTQSRINKAIASLSIINSVNYLFAELSATGYSEADNFLEQSKRYQETVTQNIYNKFNIKTYKAKNSSVSGGKPVAGFEPENTPVPVLDNYQQVNMVQALQRNWTDIALIVFYCFFFFIGAYISILRFDVR